MSRHHRLDDSREGASGDSNDGLHKASLEANDAKQQVLPTNLPECPTDGKFLTLVPYIYDYCEAIAKTRTPDHLHDPISVPLPFGKRFSVEPKRIVAKFHSMVDKISLGKSGTLQCRFEIEDGKKIIRFDQSCIETHSLTKPFLGHREKPFYLERIDTPKKQTNMVFDNPAPAALRKWLESDPRDVIRKDLEEEANPPPIDKVAEGPVVPVEQQYEKRKKK